MCTPWDEASREPRERSASRCTRSPRPDLINLPLIDAIADTGKPLMLSTGMATWDEIERTVAHLGERGADFAILHCVSTYPAPFENLNLRTIERLRAFGVPVGYSSHERGIAMPIAAVTLGACIVEKHITLDRTLPGPDHAASVERSGIERMVRDIRNLELALAGEEKQLSAMELQNRLVLRKSLVAARDLSSGTIVEPEMVTTLGPGKGLSPQRIDELVGVTLHRDVAAQEYFTEGDLLRPEAMQIDSAPLRKRWGLKARFHDLDEILALKPQLVELHFSEEDLDHAWTPPPQPLEQQLVVHALEFSQQRLLDLSSHDEEWRERCDRAAPAHDRPVDGARRALHRPGLRRDPRRRDVHGRARPRHRRAHGPRRSTRCAGSIPAARSCCPRTCRRARGTSAASGSRTSGRTPSTWSRSARRRAWG